MFRCRLQEASRLINAGEFKAAIDVLLKVLIADPNNGPAQRLLGWAYLADGDLQRSLEHVAKAIEIQPDDYESRTRLGTLILAVGKETGQEHFRKAVELNPKFAAAWEGLIKSLLRKGERDLAEAALREAKESLKPADYQNVWVVVRHEVEGSRMQEGKRLMPPR